MSRNVGVAIAAAVVGALVVVLYNVLVPHPAPPLPPPPCNQGTCPITVSIYSGDCSNPSNILAAPDTAPIKRGNNSPRIEWTIVADGYTFAANGIDFHGDAQFYNGGPVGSTKFQWFDRNQDDKYHKYSINLLHNGSACPPLDPGIINGQ
jgi:hypothetical protein